MKGEIDRLGFDIQVEIATRARSEEWISPDMPLPDPDHVAFRKGYDSWSWIPILRFLLTDPHVWTCYDNRRAGTLSREWEIIEPEENGNAKINQAISDWMDSIDVERIVGDILDAPFFGFSPLEIVWKPGELWLPERVEGKPTEWFHFDAEGNLRFRSRANMYLGELLPDMKFIIAQHGASYGNPYGEKLLSRCFWPVTWKRASQKFWAMFTEKYGMPWATGKVPPGTGPDERNLFLANLKAMVQDAVAVISDNQSIEFPDNHSGKSVSESIYKGLIDTADSQISKAILGQVLTTEGSDEGKGTNALGKVHENTLTLKFQQDQRLVARCFNRLFRWIVDLNAGQNVPAPTFGWFEDEDLQKERAERDDLLKGQGVRFTRKYYTETYNLADDDIEAELQNDPTPPPGTGGRLSALGPGAPDPRKLPGQPDKKPEFAEYLGEAAGFRAIQEMVWDAAPVGADALEAAFEPVLAWIRKQKSVSAVQKGLLAQYPAIRFDLFSRPLGRAEFAAALTGGKAVDDENDREFADGSFAEEAFPAFHWDMAFDEAVRFFRNKGFAISPNSWKDVWQDAHAHVFTVARVTSMDVLKDIRAVVDQALADGLSQEAFNDLIIPKLKAKGWWSDQRKGETIIMPSGEKRKRLAPYRLETIYETNLGVAYQTGRWKQIQEVKAYRPWLQLQGVLDDRTRESHRALWGKVWHADDPVWKTLYPPLDWHCRCYVKTLSNRQLDARGLKPEKGWPSDNKGEPFKPGLGWAYNPGEAGLSAWKPDLEKYTAAEQELIKAALARVNEER